MEPKDNRIEFNWEEYKPFFEEARTNHHKRNVLQIIKPDEKIPYIPGLISFIIAGDGTIYFATDQQHDEDLELIKKEALKKYLISKNLPPNDFTKIKFPNGFFDPTSRTRISIDKMYDGGIRASVARSEITLQASTEPNSNQLRKIDQITSTYGIEYGSFFMFWPNGEKTVLSLKATAEMGFTTFNNITMALLQRKARIMQKQAALALNVLDKLKLYKLADKIENKILGY